MPADLAALLDDLLAETARVEAYVAPLDEAGFLRPTPAEGWSIRDQLTHLARFDDVTVQAVTDPAGFEAVRAAAAAGVEGIVDAATREDRRLSGPEALDWLRRARSRLVAELAPVPPGQRAPWFGPDMTVASMVTARIMETWAHGHDVADAVGVPVAPGPGLRHVAFIGARAFANSFVANGRPVPDAPVRVELTGPGGEPWTAGPEDAPDVVRGGLYDFCLVVTRRRHPDDTDLVATGPVAREWLSVAQAFAGPPGPGREPTGGTR